MPFFVTELPKKAKDDSAKVIKKDTEVKESKTPVKQQETNAESIIEKATPETQYSTPCCTAEKEVEKDSP